MLSKIVLCFSLITYSLNQDFEFWNNNLKRTIKRDFVQLENIDYEKTKKTLIYLPGYYSTPIYHQNIFRAAFMSPVDDFTKVIILRPPYNKMKYIFHEKAGHIGTSWFDVFDEKKTLPERSYDYKGVEKSRLYINKFLDNELLLLDGKHSNLMIGGHEQGGAMALHTGLNYRKPLKCIMCISGFKLKHTTFTQKLYENIPIFISHGDSDKVVPHKIAEQTFNVDGWMSKAKN